MSAVADHELTVDIASTAIIVCLNRESLHAIAVEGINNLVVVDGNTSEVVALTNEIKSCREVAALRVGLSANGEVESPSAVADFRGRIQAEFFHLDSAVKLIRSNPAACFGLLVLNCAGVLPVGVSLASGSSLKGDGVVEATSFQCSLSVGITEIVDESGSLIILHVNSDG